MGSFGTLPILTREVDTAGSDDGSRNSASSAVRIFSLCKTLTGIKHPNISRLLDAKLTPPSRLLYIFEAYTTSLASLMPLPPKIGDEVCRSISLAIEFLHETSFITIGNLSPHNIFRLPNGHWKLSHWWIMTSSENGNLINYPVAEPKYLAPELLNCIDLDDVEDDYLPCPSIHTLLNPCCDLWSFGILCFELFSGQILWPKANLHFIFTRLISFVLMQDQSPLEILMSNTDISLSDEHASILNELLCIDSYSRSLELKDNYDSKVDRLSPPAVFNVFSNECSDRAIQQVMDEIAFIQTESNLSVATCVRSLPMEEQFYLFQLISADPQLVLDKPAPAMIKLETFRHSSKSKESTRLSRKPRTSADMFDDKTIVLGDSSAIISKLDSLNIDTLDVFYPLLDGLINEDDPVACDLPIQIRDRDLLHQLKRCVIFRHVLSSLPHSMPALKYFCATDIPPLYRALAWAGLLGVRGDIEHEYASLDCQTWHKSHPQIDLDLPRCHQNHPLMSSPVACAKLKRVLTAWLRANPGCDYSQGLDSVAKPFVILNFDNEPLAYACFSQFVAKYQRNFFTRACSDDQNEVSKECLEIFNLLVTFHLPLLKKHFATWDQESDPTMYALSWFVTMFAHSLPLDKLFAVWDCLIAQEATFSFCLAVAVMSQMQAVLRQCDFGDGVPLCHRIHELDIDRLIADAKSIKSKTPPSLYDRRLGGSGSITESLSPDPLVMPPLALYELKNRNCPTISGKDLIGLMGNDQTGRLPPILIDTRPVDEFRRGAFPDAHNAPVTNIAGVPVQTEIHVVMLKKILSRYTHALDHLKVIIHSRWEAVLPTAKLLSLDLGQPYVCSLANHGHQSFTQAYGNLLIVPDNSGGQ